MIDAIVELSEFRADNKQHGNNSVREHYFLKPNKENSMRFLGLHT